MNIQNEQQFENEVADYFWRQNKIVIRKNTRNRRGFIGRRKPDIVTIEPNLNIIPWELKSPRECIGNDNIGYMWFRHPNPDSDYISECRETYLNLSRLPVIIRGWSIVIGCELRYWVDHYNNLPSHDSWRLPFDYQGDMTLGGIVAPDGKGRERDRGRTKLIT